MRNHLAWGSYLQTFDIWYITSNISHIWYNVYHIWYIICHIVYKISYSISYGDPIKKLLLLNFLALSFTFTVGSPRGAFAPKNRNFMPNKIGLYQLMKKSKLGHYLNYKNTIYIKIGQCFENLWLKLYMYGNWLPSWPGLPSKLKPHY